jgi:hypothetical protein
LGRTFILFQAKPTIVHPHVRSVNTFLVKPANIVG